MLLEAGFETSVNTTPPDTTSHDNSAHKVLDSVKIYCSPASITIADDRVSCSHLAGVSVPFNTMQVLRHK